MSLATRRGAFPLNFERNFLCGVWAFILLAAIPASPQSSAPPVVKPDSAELASHDEPTTFKVNVKLVVVRAVVRDSGGHAVGGLRKEDFQIFDKGKPQVITQFEVEEPGALTAKARQSAEKIAREAISGEISSTPQSMASMPERFVGYLFDDIHLEFGDLAALRQAAERQLATLKPTDRAAIFTSSGQGALDFTDDRMKLHEALLRLQPRPVSSGFRNECPDISYYQADLILNKNDSFAKKVALQEAIDCEPVNSQGARVGNPEATVTSVSAFAISNGEHESRMALDTLKNVVQSISRMPGQRSVVLVTPGFIAPQLEFEYNDVIDRAVRAQVIVNTLDARGLYTVLPFGDVSQHLVHPPPGGKGLVRLAAASAQDELLATLAEGTGGVFFHNSNDFDEGLRRVAQAPEFPTCWPSARKI